MVDAFEATFPGTPAGVGMVRRAMAAIATKCGMDAEGLADVRLAVTEAATNAVVHAYDGRAGILSVSADVRDGLLSIVIADAGGGLAHDRDSRGLGLGLPLIATLASRFKIHSSVTGTKIHMAFPCHEAESGGR